VTQGFLLEPQTAVRVDVAAPDLIHVTGEDRVAFLHRMLTNSVNTIPVGAGRSAMLLTAKGQVVSLMQVLVSADHVDLVVPAGTGNAVSEALSRFAVMDDVLFEVQATEVVALAGPAAAETLAAVGFPEATGAASGEATSHFKQGGALCIKSRAFGTTTLSVLGPSDLKAGLTARLASASVKTLSAAETDAARIAAGEPRHGFEYCCEIAGERFPMEVGLDGAIDYGKGCYPGQEPIVRIRDRGKVNWRLVRLRLAPGAPQPVPGTVLSTAERESAGRVTSSGMWQPRGAISPYPIALALLHASVLDGSAVDLATDGGIVTAQVLLPGDPA